MTEKELTETVEKLIKIIIAEVFMDTALALCKQTGLNLVLEETADGKRITAVRGTPGDTN